MKNTDKNSAFDRAAEGLFSTDLFSDYDAPDDFGAAGAIAAACFARSKQESQKIGFLAAACRSPIERRMAAALYVEALDAGEDAAFVNGATGVTMFARLTDRAFERGMPVRVDRGGHFHPITTIVTQFPIKDYVADFYCCFARDCDPEGKHAGKHAEFRFVVECDGHDFHERTKEQAAHDRSRDRTLLVHGVRTARFTGSEIHRDPMKCAAWAMAFGQNGVNEAWAGLVK